MLEAIKKAVSASPKSTHIFTASVGLLPACHKAREQLADDLSEAGYLVKVNRFGSGNGAHSGSGEDGVNSIEVRDPRDFDAPTKFFTPTLSAEAQAELSDKYDRIDAMTSEELEAANRETDAMIPAGFDDSEIMCQSCGVMTPNCTSDDGQCPPCVKGPNLNESLWNAEPCTFSRDLLEGLVIPPLAAQIDCQSCGEATPESTANNGQCPHCVEQNEIVVCERCYTTKLRFAETRDGMCKGCWTRTHSYDL